MPAKNISTLPTKALDTTNIKGKDQVIDAEGKVIANGVAREVRTDTSSFVNKTSYLENCETSAWGRALANFGIGIDNSVASANEVINAIAQRESAPQQPAQPAPWNQPAAQPTQQTPPWQTQQHPQQAAPVAQAQQQPQQAAPAPQAAAPIATAPQPPQASDDRVAIWLNEVQNIQDANQLTEWITSTNQAISADPASVQKFQKEVVPFAQQHYRKLTGQLTS